MSKEQQTRLLIENLARAIKQTIMAEKAYYANEAALLEAGVTDDQITELLEAHLKEHDPETFEWWDSQD